jgi:hypothetical protein
MANRVGKTDWRVAENIREYVRRLWGTLRRRGGDRDWAEELHLHLELAAEDARRRGETP